MPRQKIIQTGFQNSRRAVNTRCVYFCLQFVAANCFSTMGSKEKVELDSCQSNVEKVLSGMAEVFANRVQSGDC